MSQFGDDVMLIYFNLVLKRLGVIISAEHKKGLKAEYFSEF